MTVRPREGEPNTPNMNHRLSHPSHPTRRGLPIAMLMLFSVTSLHADEYPVDTTIDVLHYRFELRLRDATDSIEGMATVLIRFLREVRAPLRLDLSGTGVDRDGKGMQVDTVWVDDRVAAFRRSGDVLWIEAGELRQAGRDARVRIRYRGIAADGLHAVRDRTGTRGFFSDNWPNKTRNWLPTIDHPHEKATCEFIVTAPAHFQVVSNGLVREISVLDDSTHRTHWVQSVPISAWLYTLGVSHFAMEVTGYFEGRPLQSWVYAKERDAGFRDFSEPTADVLRYLTGYAGPFAYEKIANIESPIVGGGMEAASAIGYNERMIDGRKSKRVRNVIIHELAHQWFGNAVTEATWDDAWLSESFATYFTLRYIEHAYGAEEYREELARARNLYEAHLSKGDSFPIVASRTAETGPVTNYAVTYQKGAWVLTMLRDLIGEEAFRKGIRDYYGTHFNATARTSDLVGCMERASGMRLDRFFRQWLYRSGRIDAAYSWRYDPGKRMLEVSLTQTGKSDDAYAFPLDIRVESEGYSADRRMEVDAARMTWRFPIKRMPERVILDPGGKLLARFRQL